jgi:hypothetical protein
MVEMVHSKNIDRANKLSTNLNHLQSTMNVNHWHKVEHKSWKGKNSTDWTVYHECKPLAGPIQVATIGSKLQNNKQPSMEP